MKGEIKVNKTHRLKIWIPFFQDIADGSKNFELRKDDRDFAVGDVLFLEEYNNKTNNYTGSIIARLIIYKLLGSQFAGIENDYCILGLTVLPSYLIIK